MRTRTSLLAVAILSLAFLVVVGCTKKAGAESSVHSHGGPAAAAKSSSPTKGGGRSPGSVVLKPVGRAAAEPSTATSGSPAGGSAPQGTDRLLASRGGSPAFPLDYEIGALQPLLPAGTERGAIVRVVQEFFRQLADSKIDTKVLSPQWKDEIVRLLSEPIKKKELPAIVRIGTVNVEQGSAHAAIRMEKGTGSAVGEIYLDRVENAWYISDIQADFADLEKPAPKGAPFDPAEWKSMIKE